MSKPGDLYNKKCKKFPTRAQRVKIMESRATKKADDYKKLNYPISVVEAIGEERGKMADKIRANRSKKKKSVLSRIKDNAILVSKMPAAAIRAVSGKDLRKRHPKKQKLFGMFGKKKVKKPATPSAPAAFKARMNNIKNIVNDMDKTINSL